MNYNDSDKIFPGLDLFQIYLKERAKKSSLPSVQGRPVDKSEIVRVIMLEKPEYYKVDEFSWEWDEGSFEWMANGESFNVNLTDLKRELVAVGFEEKLDDVISRVFNFNKIYLVLPTLEVLT